MAVPCGVPRPGRGGRIWNPPLRRLPRSRSCLSGQEQREGAPLSGLGGDLDKTALAAENLPGEVEPDAQALLDSSVFFDLRCEYGDAFLVTKLQQKIIANAADNSRFLAMLCRNAVTVNPPLGLFRQFVLTRDGENKPVLNIKHQGINLIVELARLYALHSRCLAVSTHERLLQGLADEDAARELNEALTFLNEVRFAHQYKALLQGDSLSNLMPPDELSQFERNHLKDAFRIIARQQNAAQLRFGKGIA